MSTAEMAGRVHTAVAAASSNCVGVSIADPADKTTWRIDFSANASDQEKVAAATALAAFDPNAPFVPASVPMWQAKAALQAIGKLDAATSAVNASGSHQIILAWEYAADIARASPSVAAIGTALGLGSNDLDQLFIAAAAIKV